MNINKVVSEMIKTDKIRDEDSDHAYRVNTILRHLRDHQRIVKRMKPGYFRNLFHSYYQCFVCYTELKKEYTHIWRSFYDKEYRSGQSVCDICLEKILKDEKKK